MVFAGNRFIRMVLFRSLVAVFIVIFIAFVVDFVVGVSADRTAVKPNINYYNNVVGTDKKVVLTFDDGPDPVKTLQILEILQRQQVPATFFFMGERVLQHPEVAQKVYEAGYEIGNHTFTHSQQVHESQQRVTLELDVTNKVIGNVTGQPTLLYRPPYLLDIGSDVLPDPNSNNQALQWIADAGYIPVGADVDSLDWDVDSSQEIIDNVVAGLPNGHIVLLHDGGLGEHTVEALEPLIITLKEQGYEFMTTAEILGFYATDSMRVTQDLALNATDATTNGQVTALQTFLLMEGEFQFEVTGYYGVITQDAVATWQSRNGIQSEVGFVGPETRKKMDESLNIEAPMVAWPSLLERPALERQMQHFYTNMTSQTSHNVPLIMFVTIGLVAVRVVALLGLFIMTWLFPHKQKRFSSRKVSVIVPVYNEQENVIATLESIRLSTHKGIEIIVVNDGSTDRTAKLIDAYQKQYPKLVRVLHLENGGKARALNSGIAIARYNTVVTMDGDTIFTPDTIRHLVKHLVDSSVAGVAGKIYATRSRNLLNQFQYLEYVIAQNIEKQVFGWFGAVGVVPGPVGAWRKADLLAVGGYQTDTLVEDQDMTLALLTSGKKIVYEPLAIAYTETPYRVRDFVKQRLRWVFGTIQCLWKYKFYMVRFDRPRLAGLVLPNTLIYTVGLSLLSPLMDMMFFVALISNNWQELVPLYAIFLTVDGLYGALAMSGEKKRHWMLVFLPLQRIFYRFVMAYVVLKSLVRAIEGTEAFWNKVLKRGDVQGYHLQLLNEASAS